MTKFMRRALVGLVFGCFGALSTGFGQLPGSVRLLDIQPTTGVTRVTSGLNTLGGIRLTKFMEDGVVVPSAILAVTWSQTPGLAPEGLVLRLEYLMDDRSEIRLMTKALPAREKGPRTTRFEIPLSADSGRRVAAWRLQLLANGRVLEERHSAAWR